MLFTAARPDVIRAINQRWLLKFWVQHLNGGRTPSWRGVQTDDLSSLADYLSFLDVTRDTPSRFMIRFHGRMIAKTYGSLDCRGRYLDEVIPAARHHEALAPYAKAVETGAPVYTVQDVTNAEGQLVHYERLLLPFTRDGHTVDRILAAFEFVCADGRFDSRALMSAPDTAPALRLSAIIEAHAMA